MTDWLPGAVRLNATQDGGAQDRGYPPRLVLHTTEGGGTIESLFAYYHSSTFWPHFTADPVRKQIAQHIPYSRGGRALSHTTATQTNDANCIQIEIIGYSAQAAGWPSDQVDWLGHVLAPMLDELDIHRNAPPFIAYPASAGLHAAQRMGESTWARFNGICGHQHVPENDHGDPGAFDIARFLVASHLTPTPPPPVVHVPPPVTIDHGDAPVQTTDVSTPALDTSGKGIIPVPVPWADCLAVSVLIHGTDDPATVGAYRRFPTASLLRRGDTAVVVLEGGEPSGTYVLRVAHS